MTRENMAHHIEPIIMFVCGAFLMHGCVKMI